jgi:hypothetical protein
MTEDAQEAADDMIDHEARQKADAAMAAISAHEKHCGERWDQARITMKDGFEKSEQRASKLHDRINAMLWTVAVGAVALLANGALLWMSQ